MKHTNDKDEEYDDDPGGSITFLTDDIMMNPALSLAARGLYSFLRYSYEDWSAARLLDLFGCEQDELAAAFDELIDVGFLKKVESNRGGGGPGPKTFTHG
jgi:hypothetical protein